LLFCSLSNHCWLFDNDDNDSDDNNNEDDKIEDDDDDEEVRVGIKDSVSGCKDQVLCPQDFSPYGYQPFTQPYTDIR
jgi:hypothetical protein